VKPNALIAIVLAGCQSNVTTPFPPGLEPIEDNPVPTQQGGARTETLVTQGIDTDYIHTYGRGYVLLDPATVWRMSKNPSVVLASCSTNSQTVTPEDDPAYELIFSVHYSVTNVLTVEWDDEWRFGTVTGTPEAPMVAMMKHQKTQGSDFIHLSEGTIEVSATDDPAVTELAFVEDLDATGGGVGDVIKGMQHDYDSILAVAHGNPPPACP
jgi:hypothetical protein